MQKIKSINTCEYNPGIPKHNFVKSVSDKNIKSELKGNLLFLA